MTRANILIVLKVSLLVACSPQLPIVEGQGGAPSELEMVIEPEGAEPTAAPPVVRLRLTGPAALGIDPSQVFLAKGSLTDRNLADLSAGFVTEALGRRLLEATVFASEGDIVVAPHSVLEPLETYTLGLASDGLVFPLRTAVPETSPLPRAWPMGSDPSTGHLFFCGEVSLPDGAWPATLEPAGIVGTFYVGSPSGRARRCLRFDPAPGQELTGFGHPPAAINGRGLTPSPIEFADPLQSEGDAGCEPGQQPIAFGCLQVEDDRVIVKARSDALWVVGIDGAQDTVAVVRAGSRFVVRGLTPSSVAALRLETLTPAGWGHEDVTIHTAPARARPVLNEVYADAIGPEPAQEWIEILNDGTEAIALRGLAIEDVGGRTALPDDAPALLPGEYVIVASTDLDTSGLYDVAPAPGVTIVRVDTLGKSGLSNSGELIRLVDGTGAVLSTVPPLSYKQGMSISRATPWALDEDTSTFGLALPTPGLENGGLDNAPSPATLEE